MFGNEKRPLNDSLYNFGILEKIKKLREYSIIVGFFFIIARGAIESFFYENKSIKDFGIIFVITVPAFGLALFNAVHPFKGKVKYPFLGILPFFAITAEFFCGHKAFTTANSILWLYICSGIAYKDAFLINIAIVLFYLFIDFHFTDVTFAIYFEGVTFLVGSSFFGLISAYIQQNIQNSLLNEHLKTLEFAQALEEKLNYKTELYSGLAHEVKTPLTIIRHYFSSYRKKAQDSKELQVLQDNLDKLERLIVNFLKFEREYRLSDKVFEKKNNENCCLSLLIQNNISLLKLYFSRKNVELSENVEPMVIVNASQIDCEHIILNLLENALRYTPAFGRVFISLQRDAEHAVLKVSDNGIGISSEDINNIFEPYVQVKNITSSKQGLGLGLPIVKKIVEHCGGKIYVESELGKGATFTVIFPMLNSVENNTVMDLILPFNFTNSVKIENTPKNFNDDGILKRLVIVEDNNDLRDFLEEYLSSEYDILSFQNGQKAMDYLTINNIPDVVISDVYMDEMDGLTFLDNFKENFPEEAVPFVFISADDTESMRLKGLSKGAVDYITKPFSPEALKIKIATWLSLFSTSKDKKLIFINKLSDEYGLTSRENQIALMVAQGMSRKIISEKLFISLNTVKSHLASIYSKCNVKNKSEFIESFLEIKDF
ncbi:MAG: ATP-binding protein [Spirochaetales bacterium]|nr:ATP-binding protein [Spirochaetales bacterium]